MVPLRAFGYVGKFFLSGYAPARLMKGYFLFVLLIAGACIAGGEPAHAEGICIPVPGPIFALIEILSLLWWGAAELLSLAIAGINAFWVFVLFVVFVPLPRLILGIVVTLGGAFLPEINLPGNTAKTAKGNSAQAAGGTIEISERKLLVKGPARYAVCLIGILIVVSALWQYNTPDNVTHATSSTETKK